MPSLTDDEDDDDEEPLSSGNMSNEVEKSSYSSLQIWQNNILWKFET